MLPTVVTYHVERPGDASAERTIALVLEQVTQAEALGYTGAWFAEHHFGGHRGVLPAPLGMAAYVAGRTQRLRVGTSIICLPLHHPVTIAEQVALVDLLSGGRLDAGFGSGSAPADFAVFGVAHAERHARFDEALAILAHCWSGEPFDYEGQFYQVRQLAVTPRPVQPNGQLAWLAASSEPTARLAGRLGYGLQLPRGRPAAAYAPIVAAYREEWERAGQPADGQRISIARCLYLGESDEEALRTVAEATRAFARRWSPALAEAPTTRELVAGMHFCVGGPDTVAAHLRELRHVTGLTHLSLQPTWEDLPQAAALASLRRYAELMPGL